MARYIVSLVLLLFSAYGQSKLLKLSYLNHPNVTGYALPLIKQAYQDAGVDVAIHEAPSLRGFEEILSQRSDGNILVSLDLALLDPDIITVGPPIIDLEIVLLCAPQVKCDKTVLGNSKKVIVATQTSMKDLQQRYPRAKLNPFYTVNLYDRLPKMIANQRFDYAIFAISPNLPMPAHLKKLQTFVLYNTTAYHILHKRQQHIADKVAPFIAKQLKTQHPVANNGTKQENQKPIPQKNK